MKKLLLVLFTLFSIGVIVSCTADHITQEDLTEVSHEQANTFNKKENTSGNSSAFNALLPIFEEYLLATYNTTSYTLLSVTEEQYTLDKTFAVLFEIGSPVVTESVMFVQRNSGDPTVVSCTGGCDDANKTCRERYIVSPQSYECTCQGECTLRVVIPPKDKFKGYQF